MRVEQITLTEFRVDGFKIILSPFQQTCACRKLYCNHMGALLSHLGYDSLTDYFSRKLQGQKRPTTYNNIPFD